MNDEILILANQIANNGHKPTVALIKARLKQKLPLPVIISTLRSWQHDPSFIDLIEEKQAIIKNKPTHQEFNIESFEQELHNELASMKQEIFELKTLVKELLNQQKKSD